MFRERPRSRLSDRIRGKSGDEVFQELRQELDKDRKMFFDSNPNWGFTPAGSSFPRRHMFDDEDDVPSRGRTDLRSHLEDLANRHPEFADHLRSPPGWVSDFRSGGKWGGGGSGNRSASRDRFFEDNQSQNEPQREQQQAENSPTGGQQHQPSQQTEKDLDCEGASAVRTDSLNQHGLRNTVPDIKSQAANEARNQRSMSAPPDSNRAQMSNEKPQQRFVSKIEINPVNPATGQTAADSKPPVHPAKQNMHHHQNNQQQQQPQAQQQQQPQHKQSTVRHIPIFVEGRDEPILPKNVSADEEFAPSWQRQQPQPQQQFSAHQFPSQNTQRKPSQSYQPYHNQQPTQAAPPPPPPQPPQANAQPTRHPQPSCDQTDSAPPPAPPTSEPKVDPNDPISKVQVIQKEINELQKRIEAFTCKSRSDKEYIYLDEMLTRNLLKLDNISTEGKENIRAVRKEAINCVQKCINLLESKVPTPEQQMEVDKAVENGAPNSDTCFVERQNSQKDEKNKEEEGNEEQQKMEVSDQVPPKSEDSQKSVEGAPLAKDAAKEENGPMEKVPKTEQAAATDKQESLTEIKC